MEKPPSSSVPNPVTTREIKRAILSALDGLRYGSVEIIIHDGRIVQIERKEKIRPGETPRKLKV